MRWARPSVCALVAAAALSAAAWAQPGGVRVPDLAEPALRRIEARYLTDEERADLRVFHGVWRENDLASPARRARAALLVGAWDDPALADPAADPLDGAEAMVLRGDLEDALASLREMQGVRAGRLRAEALEGLGKFPEALGEVESIMALMGAQQLKDAPDLVEGARALIIRARLKGQPADDYQAIMTLLAHVRDTVDRLYWPAFVVEAELLIDKDNREDGAKALDQALRLNPACARAWRLRARLGAESFNFALTQAAAEILDRLEARLRSPGEAPRGSALADLSLAQSWLRQNDPDLAEEELAPTLERFPRMREALAQRCAVQAVRYDMQATEATLSDFDRLSPGSPLALFAVGKALAETRQYEEAADFLERAAARQANWPPPLVELGLLEVQSGRDDRALAALERVTTLDPFNVRVRNSLALLKKLASYKTVESEHFVVRFEEGVDGMMAEEMLPILEGIHAVVAGAIQHEPAQRTLIELSPDHQSFAVRIVGMPQVHTIAASTGPVIAMEAPKVGPGHTGEYDWARVIRHEYVHTVTLSRTHNRIPHWFTEAAAVYLEGAPRDYSTCELLVRALQTGTLFDMRQINIAFVRPEKPTDRAQAYAQGHWMYEFMVERFGKEAPLRLMDLYATGLREDAAMRRALSITREEFFAAFRPWAIEQARSWGMLPAPSVRELLLERLASSTEGRDRARAALESFALSAARATAGLERLAPFLLKLPAPDRASIDEWLRRYPEHPDVLELAVMLEAPDEAAPLTARAVELLGRLAATRPVDPTPHRRLARWFLAQSDSDSRGRAIEHLEFLDAREQKTGAFAIELARLYAQRSDLARAGVKAERATQIAPFDANSRELAAQVAILAQDWPRAERHLVALTRLEPDRPLHQERLERFRKLRSEREGG